MAARAMVGERVKAAGLAAAGASVVVRPALGEVGAGMVEVRVAEAGEAAQEVAGLARAVAVAGPAKVAVAVARAVAGVLSGEARAAVVWRGLVVAGVMTAVAVVEKETAVAVVVGRGPEAEAEVAVAGKVLVAAMAGDFQRKLDRTRARHVLRHGRGRLGGLEHLPLGLEMDTQSCRWPCCRDRCNAPHSPGGASTAACPKQEAVYRIWSGGQLVSGGRNTSTASLGTDFL